MCWNGDRTSSSLRVTRKPIAEPAFSKCSCSQVVRSSRWVRAARWGADCSGCPMTGTPARARPGAQGLQCAPDPRRSRHDRLVARPGPQDLLDPALGRRLTSTSTRRAGSRCGPAGADGPVVALPEIVDTAMKSGAKLPVLVRFPTSRPPLRKLQSAFAQAQQDWDCRRLHRGVPDQGQPARRRRWHPGLAPRRGLRPGGRQQAGTDGGAGAEPPGRADRLQRLQGPRIRPPGADRPQSWACRPSSSSRSPPS